MRIHVESAIPHGRHLLIQLGHDWNSPEGHRAMRILYHLAGERGVGIDDRRLTLYGGGELSELNSTRVCKAQMRRYANTPIRVTFGDIRVIANTMQQQPALQSVHKRSGPWQRINRLSDLRRAQNSGLPTRVRMEVATNLPLIHWDNLRLQTSLSCGLYSSNDRYRITLQFDLSEQDFADIDPWKHMESIKPRISEIIV